MSQKPNVVIMITDQQRADFLAREGFPLNTMPFLDSMARQGAWFNRAYTAAPICVAARVSLLTGRFPSAHCVRENRGAQYARYTHDLFDVMRDVGYATALVGKNHSHIQAGGPDYTTFYYHNGQEEDPRNPDFRAFDDYLKSLNGCVDPAPTPFPVECQLPHRIVTSAINWVDSLGEKPFFMLLSFPEPHNPYQVPEPYFSEFPTEKIPPVRATKEDLKYKGFKWWFSRRLGEYAHPDYDQQIPRSRASYLGMIHLLDDQMKRFVTHMRDTGRYDDTIFVFLSDHGDFIGDFGMVRKGPEMPDILMRIPLQIWGPGIKADAKPREDFVSITDLMPTICEAVGASIPAGVQGRSLWPMLTGQPYPKKEFEAVYGEHGYGGLLYNETDPLDFENCMNHTPQGSTFDSLNTYSQCGTMRMLRKDHYILTLDCGGEGKLYDLQNDPMELDNLFYQKEYAHLRDQLVYELLVWILREQDPLPYPVDRYRIKLDPRNYHTPYATSPMETLPE